MRILMVSPLDIFPPNTGGMSRIYNMAKYLARRHEVALACPRLARPDAEDLPVTVYQTGAPGRRQFVDPRYVSRLRSIIRKASPELIITSFCWSMLPVALARFPMRVPVHLETQNVESDRFHLAGSRWWRLMAFYERLAVRLADRIYVVSDDDRARLRAMGMAPEKSELVPNGYDDESFEPDPAAGAAMRSALGVPEDERLFLYFGHLQYGPNIEGLELLHREVLPRLDATGMRYRVAVAGRGSDALAARFQHPRLLYAGIVERIEQLINMADVVVVPLRRGGGTRVKIIESIACGRPVVSTSIGAQGLDRDACDGLLEIADDWDAFACATAKAAVRPAAAGTVPRAFRETYSWSEIAGRMSINADTPVAIASSDVRSA